MMSFIRYRNTKTAKIKIRQLQFSTIFAQSAKYNSRQYFRLYGSTNLETKKTATHKQYGANPETKKANSYEYYSTNPEINKAAVREQHLSKNEKRQPLMSNIVLI